MKDKSEIEDVLLEVPEQRDIESLRESNRKLVRAYRELFSLHSLSQQLGSLKGTSRLPSLTFEQAGRILPFRSGCLFLNGDETGSADDRHTIGEEMDIPEMSGERGAAFVDWLGRHGRPVMLPPEEKHDSLPSGSTIFVPLQALRRVVGVLVLQTSLTEDQVTQHQLTLFAILGAQIAVSFDNSRLYAKLSLKNRELLSISRDLENSRERLRTFNEELEKKVKKRTEALRAANKRLKEANRVKADFLANMSHELKTPLNHIIGYSDTLLDGLVGELESDQAGYVGKIRKKGGHLDSMINQILDLSRLESGRLILRVTKFEVGDLIARCVSSMASVAGEKGIRIESSIPDGGLLVEADREKVAAILNNLLGNAVKFTEKSGGIQISASKDIFPPLGSEEKGFIEISISDTGIGIDEKFLDVIFDRFMQIDSSSTRVYSGTGLGLAIAKELVVLHGGKISAESPSPVYRNGRGTTFTFTLPAG